MVVRFTTCCGVFDITSLYDDIYQRLATGRWFSPSTLVSFTKKTKQNKTKQNKKHSKNKRGKNNQPQKHHTTDILNVIINTPGTYNHTPTYFLACACAHEKKSLPL
jgi:hypothetical protein